MDLIKDLEKNKKNRLENSNEFVNSCKLLLDSNQAEERTVLQSLGLDAQIQEAEKNHEMQILNEKYTEEYQGKIFHISEIKSIALKYRLFVRNSRNYRGSIPADLGSIINRLVKDKKVVIGRHSDSNSKFFVMAPPHMFKGYETAGQKFKKAHDASVDSLDRFVQSFSDPILFYEVDKDHYLMLKKWGNDFNVLRMIYAFFLRTKAILVTTMTLLTAFVMIGLPTVIYQKIPAGTFETKNTIHLYGVVFWILTLAFWFYSVIIYYSWLKERMPREINTNDNFFRAN